jgi:hypothetical protein
VREQINIKDHSENEFQRVVQQGLIEGGIHVNASKNHGKTRLLFCMAQHLRNLADCRILIFDGSEAWLYGYSKIPVFTIGERDIQLITDVQTVEEIERYQLNNWELVKLALQTHKDLLFRLKTRKPSKRGFFTRTVINYLDALQRAEKATTTDNEPKGYIAYFIEEASNAFNSRSTVRLEAEEFLTVFNEARNQKEAFFTASQRAFDFSKTIRTKQNFCLGKLSPEDVMGSFRRLEKKYDIELSELPQRTWFFDGETFTSPTWKQHGKPYQINKEIKKAYIETPKPNGTQFYNMPKRKASALDKLKAIFKAILFIDRADLNKPYLWKNRPVKQQEPDQNKEEQEEDELTEEESDFRVYG